MVSENYKGSNTGTMSAYMLGSILCQQFRYNEAITWYETVTKSKNIGFMSAAAYEGLGVCYEALKDTGLALDNYEKALNDKRLGYRKNALRWKIALLTRNSDMTRSKAMCNEIIADTMAQDYRLNAEFLMAMLSN
jgi:Tfp pilus assembly protein PilF